MLLPQMLLNVIRLACFCISVLWSLSGYGSGEFCQKTAVFFHCMEAISLAPIRRLEFNHHEPGDDQNEWARIYRMAATTTHTIDEVYYALRNGALSEEYLDGEPYCMDKLPCDRKNPLSTIYRTSAASKSKNSSFAA